MSNLFRKKVAVYCYLNTNDTNGISSEVSLDLLTQQKESLIKFAEQNGWQIYDFYIDIVNPSDNEPNSISSEFKRLYLDAKTHLFDIVLCQSLSCFSNNKELSLRIIDQDFPKWGIRFIGISDFKHENTDEISYSFSNQVLCLKQNIKIKEWYLEDMSLQIEKQRTNSAHNCSQMAHDSFIPFGYRIDPSDSTHLLVEKNAAKIIQFIYNIFSEGLSTREIAACLNDSKIPAPPAYQLDQSCLSDENHGAPIYWKEHTIRSILKNEFYHNMFSTDFSYCPIISDALWKSVQNQFMGSEQDKTFVFPT